ncbi:MAG: hypothetical protein AMJ64_10585 [Betaproteobacteria bacterium SG8_39]|jgi:hypothetical protein|nr:MAG: hypothetical protein AMJ64_10585 [Betaproteobacteria bacterium SG8_39]
MSYRPEQSSAPDIDSANPHPRFFHPFGERATDRRCAACRHAIGWDSVHVFCQRARIVSVYPCGHWEREAGAD